jgi:hypothetical protein
VPRTTSVARSCADHSARALRVPRLTNGKLSPHTVSDDEVPSIGVSVARQTVSECLLDFIEESNTFRCILSIRSAHWYQRPASEGE